MYSYFSVAVRKHHATATHRLMGWFNLWFESHKSWLWRGGVAASSSMIAGAEAKGSHLELQAGNK